MRNYKNYNFYRLENKWRFSYKESKIYVVFVVG